MELILKEKDFREALKNHNWEQYKGKNLAVFVRQMPFIPMWAYMLVATYAAPFADDIVQTMPENAVETIFLKKNCGIRFDGICRQKGSGERL